MNFKNVFKILGVLLFLGAVYYVWKVNFNYRFETISENKVYKSALIKPKKLESFLVSNNIKTIIDLLDAGTQDALNPAQQADIDAEDKAVKEINKKHHLTIKHINIPSGQIPSKENLLRFYEVLDEAENYPILIHCYHGTGRAQIYSQIYRIEYENWKNADAREQTRLIVQAFGYRSSFADGKEKGDFLMQYKPRSFGNEATINRL